MLFLIVRSILTILSGPRQTTSNNKAWQTIIIRTLPLAIRILRIVRPDIVIIGILRPGVRLD